MSKHVDKILPEIPALSSRSSRNDDEHQIRVDGRELVDCRHRNVNVQANSQATSAASEEFVKANGTHAHVPTGQLDTRAVDAAAEADRLWDDIRQRMQDKLM